MTDLAENPAFVAKLDEISRQYEEITQQMHDPEIAANATRIVQLAKEYARRSVSPSTVTSTLRNCPGLNSIGDPSSSVR